MREQQLKEHKAKKLWSNYLLGKTNEETFWVKYESLLGQTSAEIKVEKTIKPIGKKKKRYYTGTAPYFFLSAVITAGLLYGLITFSRSNFGGGVPFLISLLIFLVFVMPPMLFSFECFYKMFGYVEITESGMYLKKGFLCKVHHFSWESIKRVSLRDGDVSSTDTEIYLCKLYIEGLVRYIEWNYVLPKSTHYSLVQAIEEKGIPYIYEGNNMSKYSPQSMQKYLSTKRS